MSIIDTLITNRTQADVDALLALYAKPKAMWTADEWNEFLLGNYRGAYNASDMNRVLDALDYLADRVNQFGYRKPDIRRPSITETTVVESTSRLPEGYTELEYIRSTGEQYINSEFKPNQDTRVVCDAQFTATPTFSMLFGTRVTTSLGMFALIWHIDNYFRPEYNTTLNKNIPVTVANLYNRRVYDMNKQTTTIDGVSVSYTYAAFQCPNNLYIFASNNAGKSEFLSTMKLYSCQIYDNGTLVRDYVPCLTPSKEVGLYDIVNGVFYGNAGTGYFLPGPAVSLPEGYTRLKYIQSTGTQHINSGHVIASEDMRVVMEFAYTGTHADSTLFGSENESASGSGKYSICPYGTPSFFVGGSKNLSSAYAPALNEVCTLDIEAKNGTLTDIWNGTTQKSRAYTQTLNHTQSVAIFGNNISGNVSQKTPMMLYLYLMYDSGVLVRLYTPVLTASGDIGLYDSITGAFFGNAGTGVFVAGEELESVGGVEIITTVRDYYKIGDRPPVSALAKYLDNVDHVRGALDMPSDTPAVPADISQRILIEEANNIEIILTAVEMLLNRISLSWVYSGEVYSGEV